jgi:mycothiol synthase
MFSVIVSQVSLGYNDSNPCSACEGCELAIIRNFDPDDLAAYVRLINEIDALEKLGRASSVEHTRERLEEPGRQPAEDIFLAEERGLLVGYAEVQSEVQIGRAVLDGAVHPAHRCRGVGSALLEAAVERGQEMGAGALQAPIPERMTVSRRFVEKRGFALVRRHWRMCLTGYTGAAAPTLGGFELRHFLPGDEESLCTLQNLAFADHWGFCPNTAEETRYLVNTSVCHPEGILFLCGGKRRVAYCWTMDDAADAAKAYVRMIGVDPAYRGRGLGRVVLVAALDYLTRRGIEEVELLVDSSNTPAQRLYESLGFIREGVILWYERLLVPG